VNSAAAAWPHTSAQAHSKALRLATALSCWAGECLVFLMYEPSC
jgi:hypothetical protein